MAGETLVGIPDGPFDLLRLLEPEAYARVEASIASGILPPDTFLRLDTLGDGTVDPDDVNNRSLRWGVLLELADVCQMPENLTPRTRQIIFGDSPRAFIAWYWYLGDIDKLHTRYDESYLLKPDLTQVIRERRAEEGKTIEAVPDDRRYIDPAIMEESQCRRISHSLWRVLVQRIMPEWVEPANILDFYRPVKKGLKIELDRELYEMVRALVGSVALRVDYIRDVYDEAVEVGVKGIGPVGLKDLRTLLAEEYPELY